MKKKPEIVQLNDLHFWSMLIAIGILGCGLRLYCIFHMSPTFDEPFHLFQGIHFHQEHARFTADVHPPFLDWFIGLLSPWLAEFKSAATFAKSPDLFQGPYQYRLDELSNLPGDTVLIRFRLAMQVFMAMAGFSCLWIAKQLRWRRISTLLFVAYMWLEPHIVGLTSTLGNDSLAFALMLTAFALSLTEKPWCWLLSACAYGLAWSTKWTTAFMILPLVLGAMTQTLPRRTWMTWLVGLGVGIAVVALCRDATATQMMPSTFDVRLSYLDQVITLVPQSLYFVQGFLCKSSLAVLLGLVMAMIAMKKQDFPLGCAVLLSFGICSLILPGIGVRLTLPLFATTFALISLGITSNKGAVVLVGILSFESIFHFDQLLAYQNPLAGSDPRLLDSNTDWGQGLKELSNWYQNHRSKKIALALFGGTPPEVYGWTDYVPMKSFPEIYSRTPLLEEGNFQGYVAVSRNILYGYPRPNPNLMELRKFEPLQCFQNAVCVFDTERMK